MAVSQQTAPRPTIVIRPQKIIRIDWRELWAYRELFYYFVWRDFKVKYKQTAIGAAWAIFQPFVMMVVFTVFFNRVAGIKSGSSVPYAIFSYTGLMFWNCFATAVNNASDSLVVNQAVITKIYFPRAIVPVSATIIAFVDFLFALVVFIGLAAYYGVVPGLLGVALFIPLALVTFVAGAGIGLGLSALNLKYRDVRIALPFFIQTLMFLTPVIYPITLLPHGIRWALYLNPMTGVISTFRATLLQQSSAGWPLLGLSTASALGLLFLGWFVFRTRERAFADIV